MKGVNTLSVQDVLVIATHTSKQTPDGRWVPARPIGMFGLRYRLKAAWRVFTGRADAVIWDDQ